MTEHISGVKRKEWDGKEEQRAEGVMVCSRGESGLMKPRGESDGVE